MASQRRVGSQALTLLALALSVVASMVWLSYAYGPELRTRAFWAATDVITEHPLQFVTYWVVSTGVLVFRNRSKEGRHRALSEAVTLVACGFAGWLALFVMQFLFASPYAIYQESRAASLSAAQDAANATERAIKAEEAAAAAAAERTIDASSIAKEQRRLAAHQTHLERIRPILQTDAKDLLDYSQRVGRDGHLLGGLWEMTSPEMMS